MQKVFSKSIHAVKHLFFKWCWHNAWYCWIWNLLLQNEQSGFSRISVKSNTDYVPSFFVHLKVASRQQALVVISITDSISLSLVDARNICQWIVVYRRNSPWILLRIKCHKIHHVMSFIPWYQLELRITTECPGRCFLMWSANYLYHPQNRPAQILKFKFFNRNNDERLGVTR